MSMMDISVKKKKVINKGKETSGKDRIIQTASKIKAKNKSQNGIIEAKGKRLTLRARTPR